MAISNKFGPMVLTTGNKSEMSVGYATLYGDMCGGYNVLKDVYKTEVFALSRWRNQHRPAGGAGAAGRVIPERIITKPPTAELRPTRPTRIRCRPTTMLDGILECLVEARCGFEEIVAQGYRSRHGQARSWRTALYCRIQAPPGAAGREDHAAAPSAATGAIPSPTPSGMRADARCLESSRVRFAPSPTSPSLAEGPAATASRWMRTTHVRDVRFARSPTGLLHVGNARRLLNGRGSASSCCASTTPIARARPRRSKKRIYRDLRWLGLRHELARQSDRLARLRRGGRAAEGGGPPLSLLRDRAEELERQRQLQLARGLPPIYDRASLALSAAEKAKWEAEGRKPHWRFMLSRQKVRWTDLVRGPVEIDTATMSDPVLVREDGAFLYTLPSVVDDIDIAISHVVRGEDHVTNTAAQIEIFEALGGRCRRPSRISRCWSAPGGGSLSKRLGSLSLRSLRDDGIEPLAVASYLAKIGTSRPRRAAPVAARAGRRIRLRARSAGALAAFRCRRNWPR